MARFNYCSTCADLRKILRLVADFVNSASDLTYITHNGKEKKRLTRLYPTIGDFGTDPEPEDERSIIIFYDFSSLSDNSIANRIFNDNIHALSPITKGFADITLALLHELGHNETQEELPEDYDRTEAMAEIDALYPSDEVKSTKAYLQLIDEQFATLWAIEWLSIPENRKKAKIFEKEFFRAWRG